MRVIGFSAGLRVGSQDGALSALWHSQRASVGLAPRGGLQPKRLGRVFRTRVALRLAAAQPAIENDNPNTEYTAMTEFDSIFAHSLLERYTALVPPNISSRFWLISHHTIFVICNALYHRVR